MSFVYNCPHCGQQTEAEEDWIGEEVECPTCGKKSVIAVEHSSSPVVESEGRKENDNDQKGEFSFFCPNCGTEMKVDYSMVGKEIVCDGCAEKVVISVSEERTCPYCGKEIKARAKVCRYCKKKILDSSVENLPPTDTTQVTVSIDVPNTKRTRSFGLIGFLLTIPCLLVALFMRGCVGAFAYAKNYSDYQPLNEYNVSQAVAPFTCIILLISILSIVCFVLSCFGNTIYSKRTGIVTIICSIPLFIVYGITFNLLGFGPSVLFLLSGTNSIHNAKERQRGLTPEQKEEHNAKSKVLVKKIVEYILVLVCIPLVLFVIAFIYWNVSERKYERQESKELQNIQKAIQEADADVSDSLAIKQVKIKVTVNVVNYTLPSANHRFIYGLYVDGKNFLVKRSSKLSVDFDITVDKKAEVTTKVSVINTSTMQIERTFENAEIRHEGGTSGDKIEDSAHLSFDVGDIETRK